VSGEHSWESALASERAAVDPNKTRPVADLLAAEFVLRAVIDNDEAVDAVLALYGAGFVLIAPQRLAEAAMERERAARGKR
jgi:hypothetical protein